MASISVNATSMTATMSMTTMTMNGSNSCACGATDAADRAFVLFDTLNGQTVTLPNLVFYLLQVS
jgi:hypothetical protein